MRCQDTDCARTEALSICSRAQAIRSPAAAKAGPSDHPKGKPPSGFKGGTKRRLPPSLLSFNPAVLTKVQHNKCCVQSNICTHGEVARQPPTTCDGMQIAKPQRSIKRTSNCTRANDELRAHDAYNAHNTCANHIKTSTHTRKQKHGHTYTNTTRTTATSTSTNPPRFRNQKPHTHPRPHTLDTRIHTYTHTNKYNHTHTRTHTHGHSHT